MYVTNTESDVVREVSTQKLYVLIAGRWYRAASEQGPWAFVRGDQLPAAFGRVPADSPKGDILASVDALRAAGIPFVFTRHHSNHHIRMGKRWHTRVDAWCARHADHVIAVLNRDYTINKRGTSTPPRPGAKGKVISSGH